MNKSTELGMIDFSILTTMGKKGDYSSYENVVGALENYVINNNPMGFTRKDNARDYIKSLSKDDIRKELLKNIYGLEHSILVKKSLLYFLGRLGKLINM